MSRNIIDSLYKDGLCLGCGFCESICGKDTVEMQLQKDGFFRPVVKKEVSKDQQYAIKKICQGLNIENDILFDENERIWGRVEQLYSGYSTDEQIRKKGSSGGMVSAIAVYVLETNVVDAVLQVGGDANDYERNTLKISRTKEDVLNCASSRYAPALVFNKIIEILDGGNDNFCFIGKPCDISGLKNFLKQYPQYAQRFTLTISIVCAGMPSFKGTETIINEFKAKKPVKDLLYRGNGWPGFFSFTDSEEKQYQMSYNDSWGKRLGKTVHIRCKICPDGIGIQADVAVGDAWETADGYPDFSERAGHSLLIGRTKRGVGILQDMGNNNLAEYQPLEEATIALMQPFQYKRRQKVGIRAFAFTIARKRRLNYKNLKLWTNAKLLSPRVIAGEFWGMYKRAKKKN